MKSWMATLALTALALGATGCESVNWALHPTVEAPPEGVAQVHTTWENRVLVTQDCVNEGAPLIGIGGRMYLFGQEVGFPLKGDGSVTVDVYDISPAATNGEPKMLERWQIDRKTLHRLARKDFIGWGYTLFLPWATYRPDIQRVQIQLRYVPEKGGTPLFAPPCQVTLRHDAVAEAQKK
jgi:hypothetical protein